MIFEVTSNDIERLGDEDLRTLVGYLAEQEAVRAGHSAAGVTYGGNQTAKDGGIDVRVNLSATSIHGYIPRAQTGYQVKAEDMPKAKIEAEMRPDQKLRPAIVELGKDGGAYIIVSSKGSLSDKALSERKNAMAAAIRSEPNASGLHLDFYDRRRLATWVNQNPGLIPWVKGRVGLPLSGWRPYEDWSSSPGSTTEQYLIDDHLRIVGARFEDTQGLSVSAGIKKLREVLAQPKGAARLVGLSGVGKTRLVQALFDDTISSNALRPHLAIYADLATSPSPAPLELLEHLQYLGHRCILIVDNCGIDLHQKLCVRLRQGQGSVSLITVEHDISDDEHENSSTFKLEPASLDVIEKIVARRFPRFAKPEISTIATFSEGNSRIALALANAANEGGSLADLKDSALIKRLIHQNQTENPALLQAAKACSLVYSFDGETLAGDDAALPRIAALAGQTVTELHAHIAELVRRQLIQKRSKWRALLPHALAHKLAREALQDFPLEHIQKHLVERAPERLLKSFSRRLGFLHDSPEAQKIVSGWLKENGLLTEFQNFDDMKITLLDNLAPVNPRAVFQSLEAGFKSGKIAQRAQYAARILRSLAYDPKLFDQALALIKDLTEDKVGANHSEDAVNVFKSLFFLYLSGTHARAKQRANFLRALAASEAITRKDLVLAGLDAMLECSHFSSSYRFDFGAHKRDYGFYPKNAAERREWYCETFTLAGDLTAHDYLRAPIRAIIASQFRFLASNTGLTDELIALADQFAADGGWPEGWRGVKSARDSAKKANLEVDVMKLEALAMRLQPLSLSARIVSFALPQPWDMLDDLEVDSGEISRFEKASKKMEEACEGIGKELANAHSTFDQHIPAMLNSNSSGVAKVVETIGHHTTEPNKVWELIVAHILKPEHVGKIFNLPSAFLSGLSSVNRTHSERLLNDSLKDVRLHPYIVYLQAAVGMDKSGCARLSNALKYETVPIHSFLALSMGRRCDEISAADFKNLLLAIAVRDGGCAVALKILHMRLFSKATDKKSLEPEEKEIARTLLRSVTFDRENEDRAYILGDIVRQCLSFPADEGLANQICERLLQSVAKGQIYAGHYSKLVTELGAIFPRSMLNVLVESAPTTFGSRRSIFRDFREHRQDPLQKLSDSVLLDWASEKPETRFLQLAEVIRPWRSTDRNSSEMEVEDDAPSIQWTPLALRLLDQAPDPKAIVNQLVMELHPGGWSGSLASILELRIPLVEQLIQNPNLAISNAAKVALESFKERIEWAREREAAKSREVNERFE